VVHYTALSRSYARRAIGHPWLTDKIRTLILPYVGLIRIIYGVLSSGKKFDAAKLVPRNTWPTAT